MAPNAILVDGQRSTVILRGVLACCVTLTSGATEVPSFRLPSPGRDAHTAPVAFFRSAADTSTASDTVGQSMPRDLLQIARPDGTAETAQAVGHGGYVVREGADGVLAANPRLAFLLLEVCGQLRRVFGRSAEIAVERCDDPEGIDAAPVLFAFVRTRLDGREAAAALERFNDAWWLDNMSRAQGKLEVSVEFA